jgi:hypothetical protein
MPSRCLLELCRVHFKEQSFFQFFLMLLINVIFFFFFQKIGSDVAGNYDVTNM